MNPATSAPPRGLPELLASIRTHLEAVERRLQDELHSDWPEVDEILQYGYLLGGKRLRPALLILSGQACGEINEAHLVLATVVEMIHNATLVHDDVLDDAQQRRHRRSANARWGTHASVLLGDYLFTHAFYLASTLESTEACRLIGRATNAVCEGELQQSRFQGRWDLSEADYLRIIDGKTAELTECACHLGAVTSGGDARAVRRLSLYGRLLGRAFQIIDDLLDVCGQEQRVGKTLGTDLQGRKATLPIIRLVAQLAECDRQRFARLWEQGATQQIANWLHDSDALTYAQQKARLFAQEATEQLDALPTSPARESLRQLVELVLVRTH
jgi:octaprenyl-diphosphate synthase